MDEVYVNFVDDEPHNFQMFGIHFEPQRKRGGGLAALRRFG